MRPSPAAIGIAILLNAVVFIALMLVLTPSFIATQDEALLAERATDYDAFVTARLLALQDQKTSPRLLVVLGGSTTRASLLESDFADGLRLHGLHNLRLLKLCTARQSLWETLLLTENLPTSATGVVVLGVGPSLFSMGDEVLHELSQYPRLGTRSDQLDEEFRRRQLPVAPRTGVYFIDNAAYLLARIDEPVRAFFYKERAKYVDSRYIGMGKLDSRQLRAFGESDKRVEARFQRFEENWPRNVQVLTRIVHQITKERAMRMILVETPINPRFIEESQLHDLVRRHRDRMSAFAREQGIRYVVLNTAAHLAPEDFVDWAHLSGRGAIKRSASVVLENVRSIATGEQ